MTDKKDESVVLYRGDGLILRRDEYNEIYLEYPVAGCWYDDRLCVSSKKYFVEDMTQTDIDEEQNCVHDEDWGWDVNFKADAVVHVNFDFDPDNTNNDCVEIFNEYIGFRKLYTRHDPDHVAYTAEDGEEMYEAFLYNKSGDPIKFTIGFVLGKDLIDEQ